MICGRSLINLCSGNFCFCFLIQVLTPEQHEQAERSEYNFDHADAFDWELACERLKKLKEGKNTKVNIFLKGFKIRQLFDSSFFIGSFNLA